MKKTGKMRKATRDKILAVLEDAFKKTGVPIDLKFARMVLRVLARQKNPRNDLATVMVSGIWAGVARIFEDAKEPNEEQFKLMCEEMKKVPYMVRKPVGAEFNAAAKRFPPPKGGRPRGLKDAQIMDVRYKLGQLEAEGWDRADILKRLSTEYGVSIRTIQRAWQTRKDAKSNYQGS
jgi:hypothetical protein